MKKAAIPANEASRIADLRALKLLDSAPEERFDRLTRLARRMFGVPIALVSLVDSDRQWFKSCAGLNIRETSRDVSFCGHAIHGDEVFLVDDALQDPRFSDNPLVTGDPHIRFYAGAPLRIASGSRLGTLCLLDREPREFSADDIEALRDLAEMAEQELAAVQLATMDELTLVSNRRGFEALGTHALGVAKRVHHPVALLFLDLDDFKQVNDRFGHAEGDFVLTHFARILRDNCSQADVIGRLGGDEFAVLLDGDNAVHVDRVQQDIATAIANFNTEEKRGYELAVSTGVVHHDPDRHTDLRAMLAEGDKLMYDDKRERARVNNVAA